MGAKTNELFAGKTDEILGYLRTITSAKGQTLIKRHLKNVASGIEIAMYVEKILKENKLSFSSLRSIIAHPEIEEIPTECAICGKPISQEGKLGFTCSISCGNKFGEEKRKRTCLERYGTEHVLQADSIKAKIKQSSLERFGTEYVLQSEEVKAKRKETLMQEYGVENVSQLEEVKEKKKKSSIDKYGTDNPAQSEEVKSKIAATCEEKYGVSSVFQAEEVKTRIKESLIEQYGADNPMNIPSIKQKCAERFIDAIRRKYKTFLSILENRGIPLPPSYGEYLDGEILKFKCLACGREFDVVYSTYKTSCSIWCPNCHKSHSNREKQIYEFLVELLGEGKVLRNRTLIIPVHLELDLYVPEKQLAIEFDGIYFHRASETGHNYHLNKTLECQKRGIRLLHILETEWEYREEIVKSIIKAKLGMFDRIIYARKCEVKDLSVSEYRLFLDTNHLQGYAYASKRLGLLYNGEIVACIGVGKSRFKREEIELIRFCTKLGVKVVGGLSKLLAHSGVERIFSYVDLRYFDGSGYEKAGFKLIGRSSPGYVYCKNDQILSRYQCQKHKIRKLLGEKFDPVLTEEENMTNAGWYKIYDCGMLKFAR